MKETNLAKPVAEWLRASGYTVYSEIPLSSRCIDMVGLAKNKIRVVELKLRFSKNGIRQAAICQLATNDVYLAVANNPKPKSIELCNKYGIGLLRVNNEVSILATPHQVVEPFEYLTKHLIENCLHTEPSDEAGIACMSGCGPAQAVGAGVKQYVKEHPKAGWKEIYENVPNHYSNYRSLSCVMSSYLKLPLAKIREANR